MVSASVISFWLFTFTCSPLMERVSPLPRSASACAVLERVPCVLEASSFIFWSSSEPSTSLPSLISAWRFTSASSASSAAAATFASAITSLSICFCASISISSLVGGLIPSMSGDTTRFEKNTIFLSSLAWSSLVALLFAALMHAMNTLRTLSLSMEMARSVSSRKSLAHFTTVSRCSAEKASMPTERALVSTSWKITPQRSRWAAVTVASGIHSSTRRRSSVSMSSSVSSFFSRRDSSLVL
mmetsp:Transcript_1072/g.1896  ORF Transcript_1072/g.1896 Transcript_1072/m.1896 type:complete len:242 (+) Transcript_1072:1344-2069(+)